MICANFIGPTGQQHNRQAPALSRVDRFAIKLERSLEPHRAVGHQ
jgi:hypothetical protein